MNCEEVHQNFEDFLNDRLSVNDTDEFVRHVEQCSDCYDELEVYCMVRAATEGFSDDGPENYDLTHILPEQLRERKTFVKRRQTMRFVFAAASVLLLIGAAYVFFFVL